MSTEKGNNKGGTKERNTRFWNKKLDGSEPFNFNEIYIDFVDEGRTKPCSIKFKTDQLEEVIKRHKILFSDDFAKKSDLTITWTGGKTPAISNILKVNKSIDGVETNVMTMHFYQSGLILVQGQEEDFMCYKNDTFPKIMKDISPKNARVSAPVASSDPLNVAVQRRLDNLKRTPIKPENIISRHMINSDSRIDNLEDKMIQLTERQNKDIGTINNYFKNIFDQLKELHRKDDKSENDKDLEMLVKVKDMQIQNLNETVDILRNQIESRNIQSAQKDSQSANLTKEIKEIDKKENENCINNLEHELSQKNHQIQTLNDTIECLISKQSDDHENFKKLEESMKQQILHLNNQIKHLTAMLDTSNHTAATDEDQEAPNSHSRNGYVSSNKFIKVFADSFFKHVDSNKFFGKHNQVELINTFHLEDMIERLDNMHKDDIVTTHIVIQCGFNNFKSEERHSEDILNLFYECIEKIQDKFPNAIILIGEIISHPFSGKMNRRIQVVNALLQEKYHDLNGRVRYVEHPILSKDRTRHTFFDDDRVHLNIPGTLKMLSDFYRVEKGKHPFVESIAEKCFDIWGILKMASVKSVEPQNNSFSINHIIRCRSKLLPLGFSKFVLVLIL